MTDSALRTSIITAAVAAAGPATQEDWSDNVYDLAIRIAAMCSDKSDVSRAVEVMTSSDTKVHKTFVGSVVAVRKDARSTRGVVLVHTGTEKNNIKYRLNGQEYVAPAGQEVVRTDRTDTVRGKRMAIRLRDMIGHRILLHVEMEPMSDGSGQSARIIRHFEDLGLSEDKAAKDALAERQAN